MKKALRYITGTTNVALYHDIDTQADGDVHVVVDASWASGEVRKSTSGESVWWRGFLLGHWCRTQPTIALSSCEAELVAMTLGVTEAKLAQT
eukprot:9592523-Heterocapsa_arctica.AAC.1